MACRKEVRVKNIGNKNMGSVNAMGLDGISKKLIEYVKENKRGNKDSAEETEDCLVT